jgi:hypothetical protein
MDWLNPLSVTFTVLVALLSVAPQGVRAGYKVGVGIADVTGPSAEVGFVSTLCSLSTFNINCPDRQ